MNTVDYQVLQLAYKAWSNFEPLRAQRLRLKDFTYGRQWGDLTQTPSGSIVTEGQMACMGGRKPLTNNLIRQLVKSVIGRYRQMRDESHIADPTLKDAYAANQLDELDCRALEEFLISGCAIQRVVAENRFGREGVWVDNVSPDKMFVNSIRDPRGWDVEIIGQLHDMSITEVVMRFGHGDPVRAAALRKIYANQAQVMPTTSGFFAAAGGRCRVIEVWTLEGSAATSSMLWRVRYLSPDGQLLDSTVSPYPHGGHPYLLKLYPLTDGEVHSFVEDIIDQQKCINRLITLVDHIMATSAKGALLYPIKQKPTDMTWEDVGERWGSPDAILPYDPRPGEPAPQQIITSTSDLGAYRLLDLEMKLFDNISGVGDALLGRNVAASTGQNLYEAQVRNATISLLDLLDTFTAFISQRNQKILTADIFNE